MPIWHHISAHSHTCGSDAITFVGSMSSLEVSLTVCHNLGLLRFSPPKIGGDVQNFRPNLQEFSVLTIFEFWQILSIFSFKRYFLLSDRFCSSFEVAPTRIFTQLYVTLIEDYCRLTNRKSPQSGEKPQFVFWLFLLLRLFFYEAPRLFSRNLPTMFTKIFVTKRVLLMLDFPFVSSLKSTICVSEFRLFSIESIETNPIVIFYIPKVAQSNFHNQALKNNFKLLRLNMNRKKVNQKQKQLIVGNSYYKVIFFVRNTEVQIHVKV